MFPTPSIQIGSGRLALRLTDFDAETVQTGNEDPRLRQPAHRVASVDRELPAVQVLIDVN